MADEEVRQEMTADDYVSAVNELKANTVSKADYEKLLADNKTLTNQVLNGQYVKQQGDEPTVDIDQLRHELYASDISNMSNLEFVTKQLALRKAIIDRGERDPFLPNGHDYVPNAADEAAAQKVADGLQYCVDYANGDSGIFTATLNSITVDTNPFSKISKKR